MKKLIRLLWLLPIALLASCSADEPLEGNDGKTGDELQSEFLTPGEYFGNWWENVGRIEFDMDNEYIKNSTDANDFIDNDGNILKNYDFYEGAFYQFGTPHSNTAHENIFFDSKETSKIFKTCSLTQRENLRISAMRINYLNYRMMKHDDDNNALESQEDFEADLAQLKLLPEKDEYIYNEGKKYLDLPEIGSIEILDNFTIKIDYSNLLANYSRYEYDTTGHHAYNITLILDADPTEEELSRGLSVARCLITVSVELYGDLGPFWYKKGWYDQIEEYLELHSLK